MNKLFLTFGLILCGMLPVEAQLHKPQLPSNWDQEHYKLWTTLENNGITTRLSSSDYICDLLAGYYGMQDGVIKLGVCSHDNLGQADKNTLRHESIHAIQDCLSSNRNGEVAPITTDNAYNAIADDWSPYEMMKVYKDYVPKEGDAINEVVIDYSNYEYIRSEVEAFYYAEKLSAKEIADWVDEACSTK